jgi:hypothetical protein
MSEWRKRVAERGLHCRVTRQDGERDILISLL